MPLKASPSSTADGLDKMYYQLAEFNSIAAVELAQWAHWHRSDPTMNMARVGVGWQGPTVEPSMTRMTTLPLTYFSPHALLWRRGPRIKPQAHQWARQVVAQPERATRNLHHGEPSYRRRLSCDRKGPAVETPRSSPYDVPLTQPFQEPADIFKNTTEEMHNVTAQYAASNESAQHRPVPSNSREASSNVAIQDAGEGATGGMKRNKQRHREATTAIDDDGGNGRQACGPSVVRVVTAVGSGKH
jgi:hypothetical protein